jgi:hypothetical protein
MFQKERLGGYLVDGSRYVGFKIQLLRPYTFRRYILYKIGFWNHPEMSHCRIFTIKKFCNVSDPEIWRPFTEISKVSVVKISASGSS